MPPEAVTVDGLAGLLPDPTGRPRFLGAGAGFAATGSWAGARFAVTGSWSGAGVASGSPEKGGGS